MKTFSSLTSWKPCWKTISWPMCMCALLLWSNGSSSEVPLGKGSWGEEDGACVLGVEVLLDALDLPAADLEDEVVEVVVDAPVAQFRVRLRLDRHAVALGGERERRQSDRAGQGGGGDAGQHLAKLGFVLGPGDALQRARHPPGGGVRQVGEDLVDVALGEDLHELGHEFLVLLLDRRRRRPGGHGSPSDSSRIRYSPAMRATLARPRTGGERATGEGIGDFSKRLPLLRFGEPSQAAVGPSTRGWPGSLPQEDARPQPTVGPGRRSAQPFRNLSSSAR